MVTAGVLQNFLISLIKVFFGLTLMVEFVTEHSRLSPRRDRIGRIESNQSPSARREQCAIPLILTARSEEDFLTAQRQSVNTIYCSVEISLTSKGNIDLASECYGVGHQKEAVGIECD